MVITRRSTETASGRPKARSLAAVVAALALLSGVPIASSGEGEPQISVTDANGVYSVAATFAVTESPAFVLAALTDYGRIPEFMPEVRTSTVLERSDDRVIVEQEAVARFMMFSRRVHLVLEVKEGPQHIRFRDRCGKSFSLYEGSWRISTRNGWTVVAYELDAKPSFEVPGFLLRRLLKRDATDMIDRLKSEIKGRAQGT